MKLIARLVLSGISCGILSLLLIHHAEMIAALGLPLYVIAMVAYSAWTIAAVFFSEKVLP